MTNSTEFFYKANDYITKKGFQWEIDFVRNIKPLSEQEDWYFYYQYVWVVLNAGMKEQIARKIFDRFFEEKRFEIIGHLGKRAAIKDAALHYKEWFVNLQSFTLQSAQLNYLESLPWIGPTTKYHLARNIGIDCVKPDRHLVRLAKEYGFNSPSEMCKEIAEIIPEKIGVIDMILWRYCNLTGEYK